MTILPRSLLFAACFSCLSALFFSPLTFSKNFLLGKHLALTDRPDVQDFMEHMTTQHGFDKQELKAWFNKIHINQTIINQMNHPAEAKPWHQYQKIFMTEQNIQNGVEFWQTHEKTLKQAEKIYGVPPEIIVGILGVETRYGRNTGNFLVLEALATLSFEYPKRAAFFKKELEAFLLLVREQKFNPLLIKGSYAGAMGKPQFISSSYRHFAVDFENKGHKDILNNTPDAIGSVANYFKLNGWQAHQPVLVHAVTHSDKHVALPKDKKNPKPTFTVQEWIEDYDVSPSEDLPKLSIQDLLTKPAALIELEGQAGKEYSLGLTNFYVITRYNHSDHYAMAVYQLGQAIQERITQISQND